MHIMLILDVQQGFWVATADLLAFAGLKTVTTKKRERVKSPIALAAATIAQGSLLCEFKKVFLNNIFLF